MKFKDLRKLIANRFIDLKIYRSNKIDLNPSEMIFSVNTLSEHFDQYDVLETRCEHDHIVVSLFNDPTTPKENKSYAKSRREKKIFDELIDELRFNLKMIVKYHTMMKNEGGFIERLFNIEWNSFIKVELIYDLLSRGFNVPTRDWWKNVYEYIHS